MIFTIIAVLAAFCHGYLLRRHDALQEQMAMRRLYRGPARRQRRIAYKQRKAKTRRHRYVSPELKAAVWKRDNGACVYCGIGPATVPGVRLELDHVVPFSWGGPTTYDNLQLLCHRHNSDKGNAFAG